MLTKETYYRPRLKVLALSPTLLPGGAEYHLSTLMRHSLRVEWAGIYVLRQDGLQNALSQHCGVPVTYVDLNGRTLEQSIVDALYANQPRFDVLVYWGLKPTDFGAWNCPSIHIAHSSGSEFATYEQETNVRRLGESLATHHVAVSRSALQMFSREVREKGNPVVIHNGGDLEKVAPGYGRDWQRKQWGLKDDEKLILYNGRMFEGKGPDVALAALRYLPENYRLCLHGWGPMRESLKKMAESDYPGRVIFPHPRFRSLGDIYAAADYIVIPSDTEACCIVLIEALQSGTPTICSKFDGIVELQELFDNPLVWTVNRPPTAHELAQAIESVDPEDGRTRVAQVQAMTYFSASAFVARWEKFFYDVHQQWHRIGFHGGVEIPGYEKASVQRGNAAGKVGAPTRARQTNPTGNGRMVQAPPRAENEEAEHMASTARGGPEGQ